MSPVSSTLRPTVTLRAVEMPTSTMDRVADARRGKAADALVLVLACGHGRRADHHHHERVWDPQTRPHLTTLPQRGRDHKIVPLGRQSPHKDGFALSRSDPDR